MFPWPDHPAFNTPLNTFKGVGPKTEAKLVEAGLTTTGDLLARPPRYYQDRRNPQNIIDLADQCEGLISAEVVTARQCWSPRTRRRFIECTVEDDSGRLVLVWFQALPYLLKSLTKGTRLTAFGKVRFTAKRREMAHPDIEIEPDIDPEECLSEAQRQDVRPVYSPVSEVPPSLLRRLTAEAVKMLEGCPPLFDQSWLDSQKLIDPISALKTIHQPPNGIEGPLPKPGESRAFRSLAFYELLFWRLLTLKEKSQKAVALKRDKLEHGRKTAQNFIINLPFKCSPEQTRVIEEIIQDLSGAAPMGRLLQGEVGSGKTAVAGAAAFFALGRGRQAAIMAPTDVLARQHYEFLAPMADKLGFRAGLLLGSQSAKERKEARAQLAAGQLDLAIGTQALLSSATVFRDLGLAVIDEQHRFGVKQRLALRQKSAQVDLLALSATPIPRSLALILYGDLELSSLTGLLPGRKPVKTSMFGPDDADLAYQTFLDLLGPGGQGFVISPRIGEGITVEPAESADEETEAPRPSIDDIALRLAAMSENADKIAVLHGRQNLEERQKIMDDFRQNRRQVLVATTIVEVGVDVPKASVILIDGAENFGLAQLHQLRGRVGRAGQQAYCLLLPGGQLTENGAARLRAMLDTHDGFALADLDLKLRGPGEQMGLKQSGWPALSWARLPKDFPLIPKAHQMAEEIMCQGLMPGLNLDAALERLRDSLLVELPEAG